MTEMYLRLLEVAGFRAIDRLVLEFRPGLNVLIGENNSAKSAVVDALRLALGFGEQTRGAYVTPDDFHIDHGTGVRAEAIEFHLHFAETDEGERGAFRELLVELGDGEVEYQLHVRYSLKELRGRQRVRWDQWGGEHEGQQVPGEVLSWMSSVYLGALRDVERELRPGRSNKLGDLFEIVAGNLGSDREALASGLGGFLDEQREWRTLIDTGAEKVNEHLRHTEIAGKEQDVDIGFVPFEFRKIVNLLRIQIPHPGEPFQLDRNGLGYNNLIYTAAVLGDLDGRKDSDSETYVALLIEEPEAHLHPQLQNLFFRYLGELDQSNFQTFVTSHSAIITSRAALESLNILRIEDNRQIRATSIANCCLDETNTRFLTKFLDVTKSQMFFSSGVVLVEGISEALLLPALAERVGSGYDILKYGIEIVNIGGVAFEHFGKLFNHGDPGRRLPVRCAILTDNDRREDGEVSPRAERASELRGGNLEVFLAERTFEFELYRTGSNSTLMRSLFSQMHSRRSEQLMEPDGSEDEALEFVQAVSDCKAKSELAHRLSVALTASDVEFAVPGYIGRAIEWVLGSE
jgi:putative ATP-dependent endonuclease of the OLD family